MNRKIYGPYLAPCYAPPDAGSGSGGDGDEDRSEFAQDLADLEGSDDNADDGDGDGEGAEGKSDKGDKEDSGGEEGGEEGEEGEEGEDDGESGEEGEEGQEEEEGEEGDKGKEKPPETDETGRPTVKAIKTKYPNLFKDFPALKTAFFQLPKYQEVFADPEMAQEASVKSSEFDRLEASLVEGGSADIIFQTLAENNPRALKEIVQDLPRAIREIDSNLYLDLTRPILEELVYYASQHGQKIGGKSGQNLFLAAKWISNYLWANGGEIPDVGRRETTKKEPSAAEKQLQAERAQYSKEKFNTAANEIESGITKDLDSFIGGKLSSLNPFERKQVIKETRKEIDTTLSADKAFQTTMRGLWKRARDDGYSDASKSRIKRAWLDRARGIAPGIRNRLRQEVLTARGASGKENAGGKEKGKRNIPSSGGPSQGRGKGFRDPKKIAWSKTTDMDILNS